MKRSERARDKMREMDPRLRLQTAEAIAAAAVEATGLPDEITTPSSIDPSSPAASNRIRVVAPSQRLTPPGSGGEPPDTTSDSQLWIWRSAVVRDLQAEPPLSECQTLRAYLPLDRLAIWHSVTANVFDYDVWHEIDDLTKPVPQAYYEASGEAPGITWANWGQFGESHKPVQIEGQPNWYRSNLYGQAGERLPSLAWADFITTPDTSNTGVVRMLAVEDYLALQAESTP